MFGSSQAYAQLSYTFSASSGTYTPVSATATAVPALRADDVISGALPLGFSFVFDGTTYTSVKASSNGFLSFNPAAGSNLTNNLSGNSALNEKPLVAPLWDDLDGRPTGATSSASYETTGTAGSRVFTFQWQNWEWYYTANAAVISFQVKLYEGSNRIEFVYNPEAAAPTGGLSASIGIASSGSVGCPNDFLSLSDASASPTASSTTETRSINTRPAAGQVYAFTPNPATMACTPVRCLSVSNVTGTSAQINFRGSASATGYTVTYQAGSNPAQTVTPAPTSSPVALSGLTANTTYTVTVTANCAGGTTSTPVTITFSTSNGYCGSGSGGTALGGSCGSNNVTGVAVVGTTLNASGLTCSTPVTGTAYTNYPAVAPTTGTLLIGVTYPISVTTSGNSIISAWLDYNHDMVFQANEWVQVATTSTAGTASTANFLIPLTSTYTGPTVLRIRTRSVGSPNGAGDACTQFFSGETKDFTVNIGPAPACTPPSGLTATNLTTTSASLNFTPASSGTYTLVYGPQGFNPAVSGTTITGATASTAISGLQPGTTYQFYVQRDCGGAGLSINAGPVNFTTVIGNDDPCGATTLAISTTGCMPFGTTSLGATTTAPNGYTNPGAGCGPNNAPRDVWFKFTTDATGPNSTGVRISVTGGPASVVQALSAASCTGPFTIIRCVGTAANTAAPNLDLTNLTPNTTYYVRVFGFTSASTLGNFTICVTGVPSCPAPTALNALNVTKNSALLSWTPGMGTTPGGSTYSVIYGAPGFNPNTAGTTVSGLSGSSYQLLNLTAQTNYCFYVRLSCGGLNGNSTLVGPTCFQTLLESPSNDDPCGAEPLALNNMPVSGNNTGATSSLQPGIDTSVPACSPSAQPRDVYYAITGPAAPNNAITFTVTGVAAGMLRVYESADCASGPFRLVYCQAATASNTGFMAPFTMPDAVPGRTYYVAISGYGSSDAAGPFTIAAQPFFIAPPCEPVTALTVGSLTAVSASVSFTPGVNNTSYTVSYTPMGGTATTVTPAPTASPVALTGLTPGTTYSLTVTPICATGGTATATTTTFTTPAAPPCEPVTALTVGSITGNSASVSFTPGANNTSYTVTYTPAGGTAIPVSPNPTTSPVTLTGLLGNTTYTVSVTPNCATGGTATATTTTFTTQPAPCGSITALTAGSITTTSASVSFTAGANNTSYTVTYTPMGGMPTTVTPAPTGSPVVLSGLQHSTTYTVSVTPVCAMGGAGSATTTTFTTLTPPCDPVTALAVGSITQTSASVSFTPGTGNTSYTVTYAPAGGPAVPVSPNPTTSPVALTGLTANTTYTVTVTPVCAGGGTAAATTVTFSTLAPPLCNPVSALIIGNITTTSASVSFNPGTNNTSYTVTYTPMGGTPVTVTPAPTASPVLLTGLTAGTPYTVTVTPVCATGGTAAATTTTFSTPLSSRMALNGALLSVYPNPARHSFTVSVPALGSIRRADVQLVNALGQVVQSKTVSLSANGTDVAMDATGLATGLYLVQVRAGGETATLRLSVE